MYKEHFIDKKIIIFDLDGTIVDSAYYWDLALLSVLQKIGVYSELAKYGMGAYIGERIKRILDVEGNPSKIPLNELIKHGNDTFLSLIEKEEAFLPRPGFMELVAALRERGKTIVLASNTDNYVVEKMTEHLGISGVFDYVMTGDMVKHRKPDPEIYNSIVKHFGVTNSQCLVFEDSWPGIEAARRAKIATIAIYDDTWAINPQEYPNTVLFYEVDFSTLPYNLDTTPEEEMQMADATSRANMELYKQNQDIARLEALQEIDEDTKPTN